MKNFINKTALLSLSAAVVLGMSACGGGSDGASVSAVQTGTMEYLDSKVAGVDYECGSKSGITDANGTFTFESDAGCVLSLAGITLREIRVENLIDKEKIVEDNVSVARFLQSIDNDGNASNGIEITPAVRGVLTQLLSNNDVTDLSDGNLNKLDILIQGVKDLVTEFNGVNISSEQAQAHLKSTQASVLKDQLKGKTLYLVGSNEENKWITQYEFSDDMREVNTTELDVENGTVGNDIVLDINGSMITITDRYILKFRERTKDYFLFDNLSLENEEKGESKLYTDRTKAESAYALLNQVFDTGMGLQENLKGKTVFVVGQKVSGEYDKWKDQYVFNTDGTQVTITPLDVPQAGTTHDVTISDTNITISGSQSFGVLDETAGDYIRFDNYPLSGSGEPAGESYYYLDRSEADAKYDSFSPEI